MKNKVEIEIGDFYLSKMDNGNYWLEHITGEAMEVNKEKLKELISIFYDDNF